MKTRKLKAMSKNKIILLVLSFLMTSIWNTYAQVATVSGVVQDKSGETIIGANVLVKGTANGAITDLNGKFTISGVSTNGTLVVTYIGYVSKEIAVKNQTNFIITLEEDSRALEEVVVIGYQTVKRKDLTGSVASVSGKQIAAMPVANAAQALQGKLSGVNVTTQDGRPDATVSIRVRGGGSISQSNDPLVLIDGVSGSLNDISADLIESIDVLKDASSTAIYGARGANGVILVTTKGAKEGRVVVSYNGYMKYNTPTKYLDALDPYDYLAYTWASGASVGGNSYTEPFEKLYGIGRYTTTNLNGIESYRNMKADNIQKKVYDDSFSHNHDLSITGGTEKTKVLFAVNYTDEDGMKLASYYKRANVSLKVNQKIAKNVDISLDTRYTNTKKMGDEGVRNGSGSVLSSSYRFRPIATENILGDLNAMNEGMIENYAKQSQWDRYNPVNRINDNYSPKDYQALRGILSLNWEIVKGLTYHSDLSLNQSWNQNKTWTGAIVNSYMDDNTGEILYAGNAELEKSNKWGLRWSNTLNYDFSLGKAHRFSILAGHEVSDSGGDGLKASGTYYPANFTKENAFAMINQYDGTQGVGQFSSSVSIPGRILSFFSRLNYNLLDRYLLTVTFRADGSSKFSPNNRWGYFPAAALGWRMSEESFLKDIEWLDNLKLRVSYGQVGNDGISSSLWSQTWSATTDVRQQDAVNNTLLPSYSLATELANKDLKWETTITRNIGFDFGFFNNRLTGTIDAYWNTTKDLLMKTTIPGITGFTATYANVGQTSNKGIEIALQGVLVQTKDWNVTAGFNINFNRGNVDELADNVTGLYGTQWASGSTFPSSDYILMEGKPVGLVRGLIADGFYTTSDFTYANGIYTLKEGIPDISSVVFPNYHLHSGMNERPAGQSAYPGMPKFKDRDNNGIINDDDVEVIGDMTPVHTGGFNINTSYKNFDLGLYFNWSYGNEIYNANKLGALYGYKESGVYENKLSLVKDCYKIYDVVGGQLVALTTPEQLDAANVNAKLPLAYSENGYVSTLGIEDGSYLRLNTLTLGYTLPKQFIKKAGISNLRVYGSIYNVFTITGYSGLDAEVNTNTSTSDYPKWGLDWGTYPRARSFVLGVNISF